MEQNKRTIILLIILAVVVIFGGYFWYTKATFKPAPVQTNPNVDQNPVKVEQAQGGMTKSLIGGFPSNIPVEAANIFESYKADYTDHGVTQYTVSYRSDKTVSALWDTYNGFMTAEKYVISTSDKSKGTLFGKKSDTSLLVTITTSGKQSVVKLNYIMTR